MQFDRRWAMPNKSTFSIAPITQLLRKEIHKGVWIDPFSGNFSIWDNDGILFLTNDLNPDIPSIYHMDALDFLKTFDDSSVDGVLYDPPYSLRQVVECYKGVGIEVTKETTQSSWRSKHLDEIARILKPKGKTICFGWNSNGVGKTRGMEMVRVLLVSHGGSHNDTICTVEIKKGE